MNTNEYNSSASAAVRRRFVLSPAADAAPRSGANLQQSVVAVDLARGHFLVAPAIKHVTDRVSLHWEGPGPLQRRPRTTSTIWSLWAHFVEFDVLIFTKTRFFVEVFSTFF